MIGDDLVHRALIIFDNCVSALDPGTVDEILLYHLIVSFFIVLKVEDRLDDRSSFELYLYKSTQTDSYFELQKYVAPEMDTLVWTPELFYRLEE